MAIRFQYNKTSLGELDKQLKMRQKALPTIKSKESALRSEVKRAKDSAAECRTRLNSLAESVAFMSALWGEFDPALLPVPHIALSEQKIAGVRVPNLHDVNFEVRPFDLFSSPAWWGEGVEILKGIARAKAELEIYERRTRLLDYARRKTTQKVNLYEKVQIPGYEDAIRKIKRFMEDEENLSKSAQKIVKTRQQAAAKEGGEL